MFMKVRALPHEALCGRLSLSRSSRGQFRSGPGQARGGGSARDLMKESAFLCPLGVLVPG